MRRKLYCFHLIKFGTSFDYHRLSALVRGNVLLEVGHILGSDLALVALELRVQEVLGAPWTCPLTLRACRYPLWIKLVLLLLKMSRLLSFVTFDLAGSEFFKRNMSPLLQYYWIKYRFSLVYMQSAHALVSSLSMTASGFTK